MRRGSCTVDAHLVLPARQMVGLPLKQSKAMLRIADVAMPGGCAAEWPCCFMCMQHTVPGWQDEQGMDISLCATTYGQQGMLRLVSCVLCCPRHVCSVGRELIVSRGRLNRAAAVHFEVCACNKGSSEYCSLEM
jgi:hypothetical protein